MLTMFKKNNNPPISTPPLPNGRGGVKIWGLLFFYMIYEYSPVTKTIIFESLIKFLNGHVKNRKSARQKTLF